MKYALVTGGSRGIGQAVCLKLAEMGYHILINYQSNDTEAEATLQQIREQAIKSVMSWLLLALK
jgi:3-oxoacyl-[acyl-carrier protein] reductase